MSLNIALHSEDAGMTSGFPVRETTIVIGLEKSLAMRCGTITGNHWQSLGNLVTHFKKEVIYAVCTTPETTVRLLSVELPFYCELDGTR